MLLAIVFIKINLADVINILISVNALYFVMALFFVPILYVIRTYKWNILLNSVGIKVSFFNLIYVLLIGVFYGLITPGKIGELGRVYHLSERKSETIPTVLMEKIIDIFVLTMLSIITAVTFYSSHQQLWQGLLIFSILFVSGTCLLTNRKFTLIVTKFFGADYEDADIYVNKLLNLFHNKVTLSKVCMLSVVYYLVAYVLGYFLLRSLNIDTSMVIALPIIILMGNIPITISGLGLRESVSTVCFVLLGDKGIHGVSFSILLFVVMILLPGILGYFLTIRGKNYS